MFEPQLCKHCQTHVLTFAVTEIVQIKKVYIKEIINISNLEKINIQ